MAERIDAFTHVLPPSVVDRLVDVNPSEELRSFGAAPHLYDVETRLSDMDRHGVDRQVVTLAAPHLWAGVDPEEALSVTRYANDEIRRLADAHPDRFVPVGTLPFLSGPYLDEYERCVSDLGMPGVQIFSNVAGRPLDDPDFREFFARVDDSGRPLWIHPQLVESYDWIDDYIDHKMLGWPFDSTLAVSRLIFGGVMDECPDLRILTHHAGGMLPLVAERIASFARTRSEDEMYVEDAGALAAPVETYFARIYGDTAISSRGAEHAIRCALSFFGPERTLFGADYPFGPDEGRYWLSNTVEVLESMDVEPATREAVFGGNVARLLEA